MQNQKNEYTGNTTGHIEYIESLSNNDLRTLYHELGTIQNECVITDDEYIASQIDMIQSILLFKRFDDNLDKMLTFLDYGTYNKHDVTHYIQFDDESIEIGRSQFDLRTPHVVFDKFENDRITRNDLLIQKIGTCEIPPNNPDEREYTEMHLYRVYNGQNGEYIYYVVNYPELIKKTNDKYNDEIIYTIVLESENDIDALIEFHDEIKNYI